MMQKLTFSEAVKQATFVIENAHDSEILGKV